MITKTALLLVVLLVVSSLGQELFYNREYQINLDTSIFDERGREGAIQYYVELWGTAAGIDAYSEYTNTESVRQEYSIRDLENCGSGVFVRKRVYVDGDLAGLVTFGIKSAGSLSRREAEREPFSPSDEFAANAEEYIEMDIHVCESDYAANTRYFFQSDVQINTCSDLHDYFPDAVDNSDAHEVSFDNGDGATFDSYWEGELVGLSVSLDFTLNYNSVGDADSGTNLQGGEFSFTFFSPTADFTNEQTQAGIDIYNYLLEQVGSDGEDFPCPDGTTVEDFFENPGQPFPNSSASSNNNNSPSSDGSILSVCVMLLFVVGSLLI